MNLHAAYVFFVSFPVFFSSSSSSPHYIDTKKISVSFTFFLINVSLKRVLPAKTDAILTGFLSHKYFLSFVLRSWMKTAFEEPAL